MDYPLIPLSSQCTAIGKIIHLEQGLLTVTIQVLASVRMWLDYLTQCHAHCKVKIDYKHCYTVVDR